MAGKREKLQLQAEARRAIPVLSRYVLEQLDFALRVGAESCGGVVLAYDDVRKACHADEAVLRERLYELNSRFARVHAAVTQFRRLTEVVDALEALRRFVDASESGRGRDAAGPDAREPQRGDGP